MYTICVDDTEEPNEAQRPTQLEHSENYEFIHTALHMHGIHTFTE